MKITFYSNFLNHHQLPFCIKMHNLLGDNFKFVSTEAVPEERLKLGYSDLSDMYSFSLNTYKSEVDCKNALKLGNDSDVVIIGSAPKYFIENRLKADKLTFYYSERIFKRGRWRLLNPKMLMGLIKNHTAYLNKRLFMLCASAYTSADFSIVGAYINKAFKWGYFPETKKYDINKLLDNKKNNRVPKIIWAGRLIEWKHPEDAIKAACFLKNENYKFELDIIGKGDMEDEIKKLIEKFDLRNEVKLTGSLKPEDVRKRMENANIFIFTSSFQEGWGAVLNEAMNSGCAVVASHAIGSVPYLVRNGYNGLIYKYRDYNDFYAKVKFLLDNPEKQHDFGIAAYGTINEIWNADIAAERLLNLSDHLLNNKKINIYSEGPCSMAEIIWNSWIKRNKQPWIG